ncbi:MAG: hypothetical protein ACI837_002148 [Crocinitomicaceae bacterium]|jgi:hypothetical protein
MMKYLISILLGIVLVTNAAAQDNIMLIAPYDKDTIETQNPLLNWMYMDGLAAANGRYFYRLILVDLKTEQSAEAGIIVNSPMIKMDGLQGSQMFYPYDAPELEAGHRYGWQIHKISNNVIIDKSEAWEFTLPLPIEPKPNYYRMKRKNDGNQYQTVNGTLYFHFEERYSDDDLEFYLYDKNNNVINADIVFDEEDGEKAGEINVKRTGSNYYELELGDYALSGTYKLIVLDAKKQKYELKFNVK